MLGGCATPNTVAVVNNVYPELPNVPELPPLNLKPVSYETPTEKSFVGMDQTNWQNLQYNMLVIKQYILLQKQRIEEVNKQRAEWKKLNLEAKK